jgi:polyhydroxyalkanoate synthesis regulator phasin
VLLLDPNISSLSGKAVLQGLVRSSQEEYNELSKQELKELVREFEDYKAMQMKALHVSTKSKINAATHTLAAIENEVYPDAYINYIY